MDARDLGTEGLKTNLWVRSFWNFCDLCDFHARNDCFGNAFALFIHCALQGFASLIFIDSDRKKHYGHPILVYYKTRRSDEMFFLFHFSSLLLRSKKQKIILKERPIFKYLNISLF